MRAHPLDRAEVRLDKPEMKPECNEDREFDEKDW
jgi:hypothetical protein